MVDIHENRSSRKEKIIHIIPLGFEIDRAVKPFEGKDGFRANKVHILSAIESNGAPEHFVEKHIKYVNIVRKKFESLGIEVCVHNTYLIDILEVIKKVSSIIYLEKLEGNIVYVNMSAAGRLTSVGATLSGMVQGANVYYVKASDYSKNEESMNKHGYTICDEVQINFLENLVINLPEKTGILVLIELCKNNSMRTSELLEFLHDSKIEGFEDYNKYTSRDEKIKFHMRLKRRILDKLYQTGYITKRKIGRETEIKITESGKYIAGISGLLS